MKTTKLVLRTWEQWESDGFHVIKGQRATAYNGRSQALFSSAQVTKTIHHSFGDIHYPHGEVLTASEPQPRTVYYADGSGYVDYGGPCGPLYFDRNGNT
jgi:hypothetical protein